MFDEPGDDRVEVIQKAEEQVEVKAAAHCC